jgi:hypothetical protein
MFPAISIILSAIELHDWGFPFHHDRFLRHIIVASTPLFLSACNNLLAAIAAPPVFSYVDSRRTFIS